MSGSAISDRGLSPFEIRARDFAHAAHTAAGDKRKYTGEDYISHPMAVADIVFSVPHTRAMRIAAILHDVPETTAVTLAEIKAEFGPEAAKIVGELTPVSKPSDGNRARRKQIDVEHLAKAGPDAQTVKLADIIHNLRTIRERDPKFARIYIPEKRAELAVLRAGDETLYAIATELAQQ